MPQFGITTIGGTGATITNYRHDIDHLYPSISLTGAAIINAAYVYAYINASGGTNQITVHCYLYDATIGNCTWVATSSTINVVNTSGAWLPLTMSGSLSAGNQYIVSVQAYNDVANRLRINGDGVAWGNIKYLADTDFIAPANYAGASSTNLSRSVYIDYSLSGGGGGSANILNMAAGYYTPIT